MVECITDSNDTLAIIPTGRGKSVCYWIAGLATMGITVVITPLIALLNDQVSKLQNFGIKVTYVSSTMSTEERDAVFNDLTKETRVKFLYLTPEFALSPQATTCFKSLTEQGMLSRFIIDEAHCVDTWGHSFRPSYGQLKELKQSDRPIAALTGTATSQTRERIIERLGMDNPVMIQSTCDRPNLHFTVIPKSGPHSKEDVVKYVQENFTNMSGIVYCFSTKDTVELAYIFKSKGIPAVYYHGQLDYFEKTDNSRAWLSGKVPVICATSAFGMGIDKSDVRFVVHLTMPRSLEEYFQEAGRAGRDGKDAQCSLMFRFEDRNKLLQLISTSASDEYREYQENALNAMVSYCMSSSCRRKLILQYFDDDSEVVCKNSCDNCRKPTSAFIEYTQQAINVCQCLEEMIVINPKINVKQLALTFKGSKSKRDVESKGFHNVAHYGVGQSVFKNDADAIRFVQHLIIHEVLMENIRVADGRFTTSFITLGKNVQLLRDKKLTIILAL